MPYIMSVTKAGNTIIMEKYYSSRYNKKGIERSANVHKSTEAQDKCNLKKAVRRLTILLNANFGPDDYHLVLDYTPESRPTTPRGSQTEHKTIYRKDAETLSEVWRGTKVCRGSGVWKEGRTSPPYHYESLRRCINI